MEFGQIPKQIFTLPHPKRSMFILDKLYTEIDSISTKNEKGIYKGIFFLLIIILSIDKLIY